MDLNELKAAAKKNSELEKSLNAIKLKQDQIVKSYQISYTKEKSSFSNKANSDFVKYFKENGFSVQSVNNGQRAWLSSLEITLSIPTAIGKNRNYSEWFMTININETKSKYKKDIHVVVANMNKFRVSKDTGKPKDLESNVQYHQTLLSEMEIESEKPITFTVSYAIKPNEKISADNLYDLLSQLNELKIF